VTRTRVLSAEQRLAERAREQRQARRRQLLRRLGWGAAGVAPFVLVGWLLLASPWLVVHRVVVKGESRLTQAQVLAAVDVRVGTPLARVDTAAVAARVRRLGPVAAVSVSRGWPDTLEVAVVERQPVVAVLVGTTWELYDGGGVRLGTAAAQPAGVPRLLVTAPGPKDPSTQAALTVLQRLPRALRVLIASVRAASPEQVTLVLTDRRVVVWGGTSDAAAKAAALVPLLKLPGHVYDVSSPTVVTRR
jgi:cell division protein FtsQ